MSTQLHHLNPFQHKFIFNQSEKSLLSRKRGSGPKAGGCGGAMEAAAPPGAGPQASSAARSLCPWLGRLMPAGAPAAVPGDLLSALRREVGV